MTMTVRDKRIYVAEIMGWKCNYNASDECLTRPHVGCKCPNPFKNANHDVDVLEWVVANWRGDTKGILWKDRVRWRRFTLALTADPLIWNNGLGYKIGNYADALLAVAL